MTTVLMMPMVHVNGTDKAELLRQVIDAGRDVNKAIETLDLAVPNARDYYPRGEGAYVVAASQHVERVNQLRRVRKELMQIAEAIADQ
jgi:hypothetical protein